MLNSIALSIAAIAPTPSIRTANESNFFSGFMNNLRHRSCQLRLAVELRVHVSQVLGGLIVVVLHAYQRLTSQMTSTNRLFPSSAESDERFPTPFAIVSAPFGVNFQSFCRRSKRFCTS